MQNFRSKTHKRFKDRFLIRRNRTKTNSMLKRWNLLSVQGTGDLHICALGRPPRAKQKTKRKKNAVIRMSIKVANNANAYDHSDHDNDKKDDEKKTLVLNPTILQY